jgi:hypothetical protein
MSTRGKWLMSEADLTSPCNVEVCDAWSFNCTSCIHLHGTILSTTLIASSHKEFFINIVMNFVGLDRYGLFPRTPRLSGLTIVILVVLSLVFLSVGNGKRNVKIRPLHFFPVFIPVLLVSLRDHWEDLDVGGRIILKLIS